MDILRWLGLVRLVIGIALVSLGLAIPQMPGASGGWGVWGLVLTGALAVAVAAVGLAARPDPTGWPSLAVGGLVLAVSLTAGPAAGVPFAAGIAAGAIGSVLIVLGGATVLLRRGRD
jgi:hypothetical protein